MLIAPIILPLLLAGVVVPTNPADSTTRTVPTPGVVVYADSCDKTCFNGTPSTQISTVDDLMRSGSAALIVRGSLAGEATIRGMRGGQIVTSIDGMKVHAACTDNMDPSTVYIELDNLDKLELNRGTSDLRYGATLGGSLNFRMKRPEVGSPLHTSTDVLYGANGNEYRLRGDVSGGSENIGARVGYTYRASGDITAGDRYNVTGSDYSKHNAGGSLVWQVDEKDQIAVDAIYDLATFIGFPALLMDTRRAEAIITSVKWSHSGEGAWSARLYANTVDHQMDDYNRPLEQINNRTFMPGMYMPMSGTSTTLGLLAESQWLIGDDALSLTLDATHLQSYAVMNMEPLDTSVAPMRMTNLGDAVVSTAGMNAMFDHAFNEQWFLRSSVRVDVSNRDLLDSSAQSTLLGYVPDAVFSRTLLATAIVLDLSYIVSEEWSHGVSVSTSERLPTHLESFGFWLYNPQSNFVTIGQPGLNKEHAYSFDVRSRYSTEVVQVNASAFVQFVDDYIAALPYEDATNGTPPLRLYDNVGSAILTGFDVAAGMQIAPTWNIGASVSWVHGEALDLNDPLPLINPLAATIRLIKEFETITVEARLRAAMAQNQFSSKLMPENATASWFTADVLATWDIIEHLQMRAGVTNIFDSFYHEHTSINDLPSRGRSFIVTLATSW